MPLHMPAQVSPIFYFSCKVKFNSNPHSNRTSLQKSDQSFQTASTPHDPEIIDSHDVLCSFTVNGNAVLPVLCCLDIKGILTVILIDSHNYMPFPIGGCVTVVAALLKAKDIQTVLPHIPMGGNRLSIYSPCRVLVLVIQQPLICNIYAPIRLMTML